MRGSIIVVLVLALGIWLGYMGYVPEGIDFSRAAMWALYALVAVVGFQFGSHGLVSTLKGLRGSTLLLPVLTMCVSMLAGALVGMLTGGWSVRDYAAIGAGCGYYSLSSVLMMQNRTVALGVTAAAQLGTIALLANLSREVLALVFAPLFRRWFGYYAPITAGGVASVDVVLPVVARVCGPGAVPVSIIHGMVLEIAVPLVLGLLTTL